jgi:hypothetical protein
MEAAMVGRQTGRPVSSGILRPDTRNRLIRLIAEEIATAHDAALAAGAHPEDLTKIIQQRTCALGSAPVAGTDRDSDA